MKKNIILATDDNYVQHCAVTIISILKNNLDVNIHILYENLTPSNIFRLKNLVENNNGLVSFHKIPEEWILSFPMSDKASDHISISTYLRLFSECVLPESIDRALYLDCDMVVVDDLSPLFELNMDNHAIATVYQYDQWALNNQSFDRLFIPCEEGYFNAGTLLINLNYWRKHNVTERLFSFINKWRDNIISHDQDVLNAVLYKENMPLDPRWNLLPFFLENNFEKYRFTYKVDYVDLVTKAKVQPAIIHYVSKPKPWEYGCKSPLKPEYFKYLKMLPWAVEEPKFSIRNWYRYVLLPFGVLIKHKLYGK